MIELEELTPTKKKDGQLFHLNPDFVVFSKTANDLTFDVKDFSLRKTKRVMSLLTRIGLIMSS